MRADVRYWLRTQPTQNYGDFLTEFLLEELFYGIDLASRPVHIVGSVIDELFVPKAQSSTPPMTGGAPVVFWGCGARSADDLAPECRANASILSVRGPHTASALRLGAGVPQGDPAFLLPALYTPRQAAQFHGRTVCIPHFHDQRPDDVLLDISGCDVVLRPNLENHTDAIRRFIDAIWSADFVLSAAMHGAITAAAYGRPFGFWNNGAIDVPFKWSDIAALMGIPATFSRSLVAAREHYAAVQPLICIPSLWRSLAVSPLLLRPAGLLKVLRHELAGCLAPEALAAFDSRVADFVIGGRRWDTMVADFMARCDEKQRISEAAENAIREARAAAESAQAEARHAGAASAAFGAERDVALRRLQELAEVAQSAEQARLVAVADADARRQEAVLAKQEAEISRNAAADATAQCVAASRAAEEARAERDGEAAKAGAAMLATRIARGELEAESSRNERLGAVTRRLERDLGAAYVKATELRATLDEQTALRQSDQAYLAGHIESLTLELATARRVIAMFETSTAWKMTWPLRRVVARWPVLRRLGRRMMPVIWRAATLQVGGRRGRALSATPTTELRIIETAVPQPEESPASIPPAQEPSAMRTEVVDIAPAPPPAVAAPMPNRLLSSTAPVVLVIDSVYPRPDRDSGSVDAVNYIHMFIALGYQVVFIADAEFSASVPARDRIEALGVVCVSADQCASVEDFLKSVGPMIDLCFLSRVYCGGRHIEAVKRLCGRAKIIFNTVDLHYLRESREAALRRDRVALNVALGTRERELAVARLADATIVVSEAEAELLAVAIPGTAVHVLPLVRDCPGRSAGYHSRHGIGFVGGFNHGPNIDAVEYFLDEVWPDLRAALPDVPFVLMGADMPERLRERRDPGLVVKGHVADLRAALETIRLMVAPLRFGAGANGKLASSLAHGVPCVASPLVAEGMGLTDGLHVAVAATPRTMRDQAIRLYTNEHDWLAMSDAGITLMRSNYSLDRGRERLDELLASIKCPLPRAAERAMADPSAAVQAEGSTGAEPGGLGGQTGAPARMIAGAGARAAMLSA